MTEVVYGIYVYGIYVYAMTNVARGSVRVRRTVVGLNTLLT